MRGSTASKIKALDKPAQPCHTPSTPSEEKMEDNRDEQTPSGPVGQAPAGERTSPGLDRRKFICAGGATAAAAAFRKVGGRGRPQPEHQPAAGPLPGLVRQYRARRSRGPGSGDSAAAGAVPGLARQIGRAHV